MQRVEAPREPDRAETARGRPRIDAGPALVVSIAWLALLGWQIAEHASEVRRHRSALVRQGETNISILEASIRTMGRRRRQDPAFLGFVVEAVSSLPGFRGARLTDGRGTTIAATGTIPDLALPDAAPLARWASDALVVGRQVDLADGLDSHAGGEMAGWPDVPRPVFLVIALDRSEVDREIRADTTLRALIAAAAAVAAAGTLVVLRTRARTRRLETDLAVAEERSQRNREWALLGAGLAHETKNPLAVVRGLAQRLLEAGTPDEGARRIVDEVDRVVARINEFLRFSRPVAPAIEAVDLEALFADMASLIAGDLASRRGTLTRETGVPAILADRDMLRQILLNVLVNGAQAIPEGGRVALAARAVSAREAVIEIRDDGPGIPAAEIDRVFEPYYTRRPGGTGLGLAIVRRLAEAHGWRVGIECPSGTGTIVRITGIERSVPDGERQTDPGRR